MPPSLSIPLRKQHPSIPTTSNLPSPWASATRRSYMLSQGTAVRSTLMPVFSSNFFVRPSIVSAPHSPSHHSSQCSVTCSAATGLCIPKLAVSEHAVNRANAFKVLRIIAFPPNYYGRLQAIVVSRDQERDRLVSGLSRHCGGPF